MKKIVSRDNPRYKLLARLAESSQARKREGLSLLDGVHLVAAYFEHHGAPEQVAVSESGARHPEVVALLERIPGEALEFPDHLFGAFTQVENSVGLVAAIRTPHPELPARIEGDCLVIEHLQDPGNLGSLLRSAAAAGVVQVLLSAKTAYAWSPKVLRSGQGAHFSLRIYEGLDLEAVLPRVAAPLVATSSHAPGALYDADLRGPVAWLLGNEGAGVSDALMGAAALRVSIPMAGLEESLNVAAAGAICMFEALRQRRAKR
ncbi:MAG TPA: RNA methyltransferase [Burkholderiales bacterium]